MRVPTIECLNPVGERIIVNQDDYLRLIHQYGYKPMPNARATQGDADEETGVAAGAVDAGDTSEGNEPAVANSHPLAFAKLIEFGLKPTATVAECNAFYYNLPSEKQAEVNAIFQAASEHVAPPAQPAPAIEVVVAGAPNPPKV